MIQGLGFRVERGDTGWRSSARLFVSCPGHPRQFLHRALTRTPWPLLQYGKVMSIDMKTPSRPPAFAFVEFG